MISTRSGHRNRAAWGTKCENRKPDRSVQIGYKKIHPRIFTHTFEQPWGGVLSLDNELLPDIHQYKSAYIYIYMNLRSEFEYFSIVCFTSQAIKYIFVYYVDCIVE